MQEPDIFDKFWAKNKKCIIEGAKELTRYILVFLIPALLDQLPMFELNILSMLVIASILRGIDKFIHSKGKETNNESLVRGLVRF